MPYIQGPFTCHLGDKKSGDGPHGETAEIGCQLSPSGPAHKSQVFGTGANADQKRFPLEACNVWVCQVSGEQDSTGFGGFGRQQLTKVHKALISQSCKLFRNHFL